MKIVAGLGRSWQSFELLSVACATTAVRSPYAFRTLSVRVLYDLLRGQYDGSTIRYDVIVPGHAAIPTDQNILRGPDVSTMVQDGCTIMYDCRTMKYDPVGSTMMPYDASTTFKVATISYDKVLHVILCRGPA